jgi:hypothetical protein
MMATMANECKDQGVFGESLTVSWASNAMADEPVNAV